MSQQDLNSPNFRGAASGTAGAAAMLVAAKGQKQWLRWLMYGFAAITLFAVGAGTIDKIANINTLPACDAQRTRDTMSDLNKANKLNATAYNFIKQISADDKEVRCTANLALRGGGKVEYDYRIFKDAGAIKVEIRTVVQRVAQRRGLLLVEGFRLPHHRFGFAIARGFCRVDVLGRRFCGGLDRFLRPGGLRRFQSQRSKRSLGALGRCDGERGQQHSQPQNRTSAHLADCEATHGRFRAVPYRRQHCRRC
jgi:hypothetical protein